MKKVSIVLLIFAISGALIFASASPNIKIWKLAYLANDTYNNYCSMENIDNFMLVDAVSGDNGFQAAKYVNDSIAVISYRGTDEWIDGLVDVQLALGTSVKITIEDQSLMFDSIGCNIDSQIEQAIKFYYKCAKNENRRIIIIGHSLGGFLAQIVGAVSGKETHTFNAPGAEAFLPYIQSRYGLSLSQRIINHLSIDPFGYFGYNIGHTERYLNVGHRIGDFYRYLKKKNY